MSQPPARPWTFRFTSMVRPNPPPPTRPPAPAPAQQQTFRPPAVRPQAAQPAPPPPAPPAASISPRTSAPPSPIPPTTPVPMTSPVASPPRRATAPPSPPPPQAKAPPSPAKTPAPTMTSPATQSPKSPVKTGESQPAPSTTKSPTTTAVKSPPPPISSKPSSPVTKSLSSLPASPGQKASPKTAATRTDVSYSPLPPSPKTKTSAPPPSPLPTTTPFQTVPSYPAPPQPFPVPTATPIATTARAAAPISSPKTDKPRVKTPPQSDKEKILSRPPSPLTLPPAQLKAGGDLEPIPAEVEQKTVLLQESEGDSKTAPKTSNGLLQRSHGEAHNDNSAQHGKRELKKDKGVQTQKKHSDSEESGIRVVTLAGENKGAIMELSLSRIKYWSGARNNGGQKLTNNNDEGSSWMKDEKHKAAGTETAPADAFVNCNVQGVNNSILYNCSSTYSDPGVHLSVSRRSNGRHGVRHTKDPMVG